MEQMLKILSVAGGGALGAVARYLVNISPLANLSENFPFPTLFINVIGSFLIGFLLILLTDKVVVGEQVRMMVVVGFLGAFTTFSTFEMDIYALLKGGLRTQALVYLLASVVVGFVSLLAGIWLARQFPNA
jgi:CrcB protein